MGGENVPYHLRPNKFVERLLFVELLEYVNDFKDLKKLYSYVSLGGKYLEDFKLVHEYLGMRELFSLEMDGQTYGRQSFNRPLQFITCIKSSATDFLKIIDKFQEDQLKKNVHHVVLWLDFTSPRGRQSQLRDFETAVSKLIPFDIVKITMNANIATVMSDDDDEDEDVRKNAALEKIKHQLGEYCPARQIEKQELHDRGLSTILTEAVDRAGLKGMKGKKGHSLHRLSAFRYNDGYHSMVTYTAIILPTSEIGRFETESRINDWPYYYPRLTEVRDISVPDLSLKERMHINELLFSAPAEKLHRRLPFKLDSNREISLGALKSYIEHYRRYPNYVRATI